MVRATSPPLPLRLSLAAAAAAAALAGLTLVSAETKIGYTSYANIWFEPEQVINNDWFGQQEWALWTAEQWTAHLNAGAPWCELSTLYNGRLPLVVVRRIIQGGDIRAGRGEMM